MLTQVVTYTIVYSVTNFIKIIYNDSMKKEYKKLALLDITGFPRLIAAVLWARVVDYTQAHIIIIMITGVGFALMFGYINAFNPIKEFGWLLILIDATHKILDSGLFPAFEMYVLKVANFEKSKDSAYGRMRMAIPAAKHFAPLFLILFEKKIKNLISVVYPMVFLSLVAALFSIFLLILCYFFVKFEKVENEIVEKEKKELKTDTFTVLKNIFSSDYVYVLIFLCTQGIIRSTLHNYQAIMVTDNNPNKTTDYRIIQALVIIPELIITFFIYAIEVTIGIDWMCLCGGFMGVSNALLSMLKPTTFKNNTYKYSYFLVSEILKIGGSVFTVHAAAKQTKYYNPVEWTTTAHSLYNAAYLGVGTVGCGIVGYFFIKATDSDQKFYNFFDAIAVVGSMGMFPILYLIYKKRKTK